MDCSIQRSASTRPLIAELELLRHENFVLVSIVLFATLVCLNSGLNLLVVVPVTTPMFKWV